MDPSTTPDSESENPSGAEAAPDAPPAPADSVPTSPPQDAPPAGSDAGAVADAEVAGAAQAQDAGASGEPGAAAGAPDAAADVTQEEGPPQDEAPPAAVMEQPPGAEPPAEEAAPAEDATSEQPAPAEDAAASSEEPSSADEPISADDAAAVEQNPEALPLASPDEDVPSTEEVEIIETGAAPEAGDSPGQGKRKKKKGRSQEGPPAADAAPKPAKPAGPDPAEVTRKIGSTNEAALRYVAAPDPQLSRLSRKVREELITDIPPVTAGALLGPDALARHFIASAASGRYRDLFSLWELFRARTEVVRPVLAERQRALERARQALTTAAKLGLRGAHAERVAHDIRQAEGLIWTWLRATLVEDLKAVGRRPLVMAALLEKEPGLEIPLPEDPSDQWLAEAAAIKQGGGSAPPAIDALLSAHIERLPATVSTLTLVSESYPDRVPQLIGRVDLASPEIGAILAWARDHGGAEHIRDRIADEVAQAAERSRSEGLAAWQAWHDRKVDVAMPQALQAPTVEGLDLARPESATLIATLIRQGAPIQPQAELDGLAAQNRQAAEKAYEAFVCAELDVHLPLALEGNPIVKEGTRCPACQAWTWVRPGHERRCPRLRDEQAAAAEAAAAETTPAQATAAEPPGAEAAAVEAAPAEGQS